MDRLVSSSDMICTRSACDYRSEDGKIEHALIRMEVVLK